MVSPTARPKPIITAEEPAHRRGHDHAHGRLPERRARRQRGRAQVIGHGGGASSASVYTIGMMAKPWRSPPRARCAARRCRASRRAVEPEPLRGQAEQRDGDDRREGGRSELGEVPEREALRCHPAHSARATRTHAAGHEQGRRRRGEAAGRAASSRPAPLPGGPVEPAPEVAGRRARARGAGPEARGGRSAGGEAQRHARDPQAFAARAARDRLRAPEETAEARGTGMSTAARSTASTTSSIAGARIRGRGSRARRSGRLAIISIRRLDLTSPLWRGFMNSLV